MPPYKKYLVLSVVFNILSALLNIFSFATLVPILQILFKTGDAGKATHFMEWDWNNVKEVVSNNADYYVTNMIADMGATTTLLIIGLFLACSLPLPHSSRQERISFHRLLSFQSVQVLCAISAISFIVRLHLCLWDSSAKSARAIS